jgi:hypothetical protein
MNGFSAIIPTVVREIDHFIENYGVKDDMQSENWSILSKLLLRDVYSSIGRRAIGRERLYTRFLTSFFAAEFFCDENPPRLLVAKSEMESHDDLREQFPSASPRVSGNVFTMHKFPFRFFSMDCVFLETNVVKLPSQKQLSDVVPWFLSHGIVPLDAQMEIISLQRSN